MFNNISMSVDLPTNVVLFYGTPKQTGAQVLYGTILLDVRKPTKINMLYVKVIGKAVPGKISGPYHTLPGTGNVYIEHKEILKHKEVIFDHSDKELTLETGNYEFGFCIKFDPSLPETILTEYGNIDYSIKAVLIKGGSVSTAIKKTAPIYVRRLTNYSDGDVFLPRPIEAIKNLKSLLWVKFSSISNCYTKGQAVKISVSLEPIPSRLKIRSIGVAIIEYLTVTDPDHPESQQTRTKVIKSVEKIVDFTPGSFDGNVSRAIQNATARSFEDSMPSYDSETEPVYADQYTAAQYKFSNDFSYDLHFEIPKSTSLLQHDLCNTIFRVQHKLRFYCTVEHEKNNRMLSTLIPFYIVPDAYMDDLINLPPYTAPEPNSPPYFSEFIEIS